MEWVRYLGWWSRGSKSIAVQTVTLLAMHIKLPDEIRGGGGGGRRIFTPNFFGMGNSQQEVAPLINWLNNFASKVNE